MTKANKNAIILAKVVVCIELLTENDEPIDYRGEPITITPIFEESASNINIFRFGLYWKQTLLGSFDTLIDAIEEADLIHNLYINPYKVGSSIECEDYEDDEFLDGEFEDDFD